MPSTSSSRSKDDDRSFLDKLLPDTLAKLVAQIIVLSIWSVGGLVWQNMDSPIFWIVFLAIAAAIASGLAIVFMRRAQSSRPEVPEPPSVGVAPSEQASRSLDVRDTARDFRLFAGIDLGRHQISHGVLRVSNASSRLGLPAADLNVQSEHRLVRATRGDHIYDDLVTTVRNLEAPFIDGLGIGIPGQVDAGGGRVVGTPEGWHDLGNFRHDFADKLAADERCREKFRLADISSRHAQVDALERKVRIDNDVNCAARAILNRHYGEPDWQHFACIYVGGTGVGGGLVLNGELFYGSNGAAGEIGHITVDFLPDAFRPRCECGRDVDSLHLQALVSGDGLAELADKLDPSAYQRLRDAAAADNRGDEVMALVSLLRDGPRSEGRAVRDLAADPRMVRYGNELLLDHARYFAIGLATLVNLLDLDHVVVGGGVMDGIWGLVLVGEVGEIPYSGEVIRQISARTLEVPREALYRKIRPVERLRRKTYAWQGAALMFCDPTHASLAPGRG